MIRPMAGTNVVPGRNNTRTNGLVDFRGPSERVLILPLPTPLVLPPHIVSAPLGIAQIAG